MAAFKRSQIHVSFGSRESGSHHIFFCSSIGDFRLLLPGAAFTIGAYSLKGGGRRHLRQLFGCFGRQQVLRGETNKKKSLAVVFCPQRCDRMDVDSTRHWKNITSSRSAGSAVPAHQTQPTSVPPHLIGRSVAELFSHWPEPQRWPVLLVAGLGCVSVSRQQSPHPWGHFIPSISAAHASLQNVWKKISEMRSSISKSVKWEISGAGRPIVSQPKVAGSDPMIRNNRKWMDWWLCASTVLKLVFLHALRSILLFRGWCIKFLDQHLWKFGRNLKAMYKSNVIGKKVGTSLLNPCTFSL